MSHINDNTISTTLQLKKEYLDIAKKWIKTEKVKIHKETFLEEKNFTVPVIHEELIIEKEPLPSADDVQDKNSTTEIIRIPLSEEQVEFAKHKVTLEDVSIYKQQVQEIKHIEETLKREEAKIKLSGSPNVIDNTQSHL